MEAVLIFLGLLVALAAPLTTCLWLTPGNAWRWLAIIAATVIALFIAARLMRRQRARRRSVCPACGYSWDGLPEAGACPECGQAFETIRSGETTGDTRAFGPPDTPG